MGTIGHWVKHLVVGMVRGCLMLAVAALAVSLVVFYVVSKRMPANGDWVLIAALVITAGVLGAAISLIWRLSHLDVLAHMVRNEAEKEHEGAKVK